MREFVPSDIITEKLLRDGKLKQTETEVDDALESRFTLRIVSFPCGKTSSCVETHPSQFNFQNKTRSHKTNLNTN